MQEDQIRNAVLKVALGFSLEEVTEEYGVEDGELRLVKRKETRKDVPPDLKAVKFLMDGQDYSALTDEELESERKRLLKEWKESYDEKRKHQRASGKTAEGSAGAGDRK